MNTKQTLQEILLSIIPPYDNGMQLYSIKDIEKKVEQKFPQQYSTEEIQQTLQDLVKNSKVTETTALDEQGNIDKEKGYHLNDWLKNTLFSLITNCLINKKQIELNVLKLVKGDFVSIEKDLGLKGKILSQKEEDIEILKIIQKFLKWINETLKLINEQHQNYSKLKIEEEILKTFLPKQLTKEEIKEKILHAKQNGIEISPKTMNPYFANNYPQQYDAKELNAMIVELQK